jgi:hypothetical protein
LWATTGVAKRRITFVFYFTITTIFWIGCKDDPRVLKVARGPVTLEDVIIGLTGSEVRP